jgi:hypothetical protein
MMPMKLLEPSLMRVLMHWLSLRRRVAQPVTRAVAS